MEIWEVKLSLQFTLYQWHLELQLLVTSLNCVTHWEASLKIIYRWYYTPVRLSKIFLSTSPNCWSECGNSASFIHIWWFCPLVLKFWNYVFTFLSSVSQLSIDCNPTTALILLHHDLLVSMQTSFIVHGIIAARRTIAPAWKQPTSPDWSLFIQ